MVEALPFCWKMYQSVPGGEVEMSDHGRLADSSIHFTGTALGFLALQNRKQSCGSEAWWEGRI